MNGKATPVDIPTAVSRLAEVASEGHLSDEAVKNIKAWLSETRYAQYVPQVLDHIAHQQWRELDDAFWTVIPFGTGGRRGRMYPIGCNVINDRTIGESAAGLASYVRDHCAGSQPACAIAYDTRHNSVEFARLCAEVMLAHGFRVYFLDDYRSTPELSFLVRLKRCDCGIMVTASHNPPSDNAVKCYWSTGGQLVPPHDKGVIDRVMQVAEVPRDDFDQAVAEGRVQLCCAEVDEAYLHAVAEQCFPGPRQLRVIYSPLHGVGSASVMPVLAADGFEEVELFGPHAAPDGDFPNVPGHVSNPENSQVFESIIQRAQESGAELILATDPDCDRLGCAAPLTSDSAGPWGTFTGNQIAALLADYVLSRLREVGSLTGQRYLVKTLVTTEMVRRIGAAYDVPTHGDLLVGFKWIGEMIDQLGPDNFVLGAEESHGYLVGQYARDKDGAVAAMLLAELAAVSKAAGKTLHERLDALYWQHGYHAERLLNLKMTGSEGMARMKALMQRFREDPPHAIMGGIAVRAVHDFLTATTRPLGGAASALAGPKGDLVMLDLAEEGNYVAVRPSGTEPKVKFYQFAYVPAEQLAALDETKATVGKRLCGIEADLTAFAESV